MNRPIPAIALLATLNAGGAAAQEIGRLGLLAFGGGQQEIKRKLYSLERFQAGVSGTGENLMNFVDRRRAFLLNR